MKFAAEKQRKNQNLNQDQDLAEVYPSFGYFAAANFIQNSNKE